jgi:hypothetical protein
MLAVVVRLEERDPQVQLEHDAADGPDVAGLRPAQLEDDFRRAVVPRGHDGAEKSEIQSIDSSWKTKLTCDAHCRRSRCQSR